MCVSVCAHTCLGLLPGYSPHLLIYSAAGTPDDVTDEVVAAVSSLFFASSSSLRSRTKTDKHFLCLHSSKNHADSLSDRFLCRFERCEDKTSGSVRP